MATITATGSKNHHNFTMEITETSYSVNNNTSDVSYTLKISPKQKGWDWNASGVTYTISVNGTQVASGSISKYDGSSTVTIKSASVTGIAHNNDGTKNLSFGFTITDNTSYTFTPGNASASGTLTLTTIPRASQIGVTDANIGSSTNITINKNSSSFTTTLYYKASGQSSWTKIVDKTSNQVYAWTVPTSFYSLIPNSKTIKCQFYADTYNGSSLVGTSSTVTATFTATGNPTISSYTLVDTNSTTTSLTGDSSKMVRYVSNVKATVTASGQHSATISSIKVNGTTASSGVVNFNGASTNSFQAIVTDSRGYTTSQTKTMTMVNYIPLTLKAAVVRNQPTDEKVNISISGNYFNNSFGSQSNSLTTQYRYKERTSSSWGSWTSISRTVSGNTYSGSLQLSDFDYTKVYDFQVRATDKIQTKSISGITVSKGTPVFNWDDNEFDINVEMNAPNSINLVSRTSHDIDTIYDAIMTAITNGTNCPSGNPYGVILNIPYRNRKGNSKPDFSGQIFIPNGDDSTSPFSMFYRTSIPNSWNNWCEIGGIINKGSTANGDFIQYSDGTLICWKKANYTATITNTWGTLYESTERVDFGDFPKTFISPPTVTATNASASGCFIEGVANTSTTSWGSSYLVRPNSRSSATYTISLIAIGKWK